MSDLTLIFNADQRRGDFILGNTDIQTGDDLKTNIMVSLFTDRGWWADTYEPDAIGCRVLELMRAKRSNNTLLQARDYCRAALKWLIDDRIAKSVDVQTAWQGSLLAIAITVTQATGTTQYSFVWGAI